MHLWSLLHSYGLTVTPLVILYLVGFSNRICTATLYYSTLT